MIDNFNQVDELITEFLTSGDWELYDIYYHLQIIKRSKDTGEGANSVCLKAYQIDIDCPYLKISEEGKKALIKANPNTWLLYSLDENPDWDHQEDLMEIATRIHLG